MATTESEYQVKWSGSDSKGLDEVTTEATSDELNCIGSSGATIVAAAITMQADATGTLTGDSVEFYLARSMGQADSDGGTTFDYATDDGTDETLHTQHLWTVDLETEANNVKTVSLPVPLGKLKIYCKTDVDSGDDVTVSAVIRGILG